MKCAYYLQIIRDLKTKNFHRTFYKYVWFYL